MKCIKHNIPKLQLIIVSTITVWLIMNYGYYLIAIGAIRAVFLDKDTKNYVKQIAYVPDIWIGGTLYGANPRDGKFNSLSANIGARKDKDEFHRIVAKVVDWKHFFGKDHCYCLAVREGLIDV